MTLGLAALLVRARSARRCNRLVGLQAHSPARAVPCRNARVERRLANRTVDIVIDADAAAREEQRTRWREELSSPRMRQQPPAPDTLAAATAAPLRCHRRSAAPRAAATAADSDSTAEPIDHLSLIHI